MTTSAIVAFLVLLAFGFTMLYAAMGGTGRVRWLWYALGAAALITAMRFNPVGQAWTRWWLG